MNHTATNHPLPLAVGHRRHSVSRALRLRVDNTTKSPAARLWFAAVAALPLAAVAFGVLQFVSR